MEQYERNHDGAALGASRHTPLEEHRTVYPYTVQGGATLPNPQEELRRRNLIHTTYLYLAVAVTACMGAAWWGSHSYSFLKLVAQSGLVGWLVILLAINMIPRKALSYARKNPRGTVPALAVVGGVLGLALAPLVFVGLAASGQNINGENLVSTACIVTGAMFAAVTAYVNLNKAKFDPKPALGWGLFALAVVIVPLNMFLHSSILSIVLSGAIGLLGIYQLLRATSVIVTNPEFNDPATGAVMLLIGVFNIFQAVLSILIGGRR